MIIFDLECESNHRFEGWFKNIGEFEKQIGTAILTCPVCGNDKVKKIPTASRINVRNLSSDRENQMPTTVQHRSPDHTVELMRRVHDYVEKNYHDVGDKFAEEAKKIHYGEVEERNIRGTATANEYKELTEEGVSALPLPALPVDKDKLN